MILVKEISPQEKIEWNNFIANSPKGHIFQSYQWGELKSKTGWKPIRLVVKQNSKILAAISILERKIPKINKTVLYAPRAPVIDKENLNHFTTLVYKIKEIASRDKSIFLKIDPDILTEDDWLSDVLIKCGFRKPIIKEALGGIQPSCVFRLSLKKDLEEIFKQMSSKTRYNIRLAHKKGVIVKKDNDVKRLPFFYKLLLETCIRDKFTVRSYPYFKNIWEILVQNNLAHFFFAYYQSQPIAATLALTIGDKSWYIYGASSNSYRNVMPNYALQWEMIKWAKENKCTFYDFRAVPCQFISNKPLSGLYRFKKGFSPHFCQFIGEYDLVFDKFFYNLWIYTLPLFKKIRKLIIPTPSPPLRTVS